MSPLAGTVLAIVLTVCSGPTKASPAPAVTAPSRSDPATARPAAAPGYARNIFFSFLIETDWADRARPVSFPFGILAMVTWRPEHPLGSALTRRHHEHRQAALRSHRPPELPRHLRGGGARRRLPGGRGPGAGPARGARRQPHRRGRRLRGGRGPAPAL